MSSWISVNEGLPDFADCYIDRKKLHLRSFQVALSDRDDAICGYYDPLCGCWCWFDVVTKSFRFESSEVFVIAWCPLSEPDDYVDRIREELR